MSLYIELTEFLKNPITTGIQRVEGELCKFLPQGAATPVVLGKDGYYKLPPELMQAIGSHFGDPSDDSVKAIRRIAAIRDTRPIEITSSDTVLVPEVIIEQRRLTFLDSLSDQELERHRFIIHDLLPITHPELFTTDWLIEICAYYRILRRAPHCAFVSEATREVYYGRLKRTRQRGGMVFSPGSDGLGSRHRKSESEKIPLNFTVLGTIEPRKNHRFILDAFEPLLRAVRGLTLSFVGNMGWVDADFAERVLKMAADKNSGLRFVSGPDDGTVRSELENARATVYLSLAEGYGIPPMESLWLGTPVIASRSVPSLQRHGDEGIHYVDPLKPELLRRAVLDFLNDDYAARKTSEAANSELPTWEGFAHEVLDWCRVASTENQLAAATN